MLADSKFTFQTVIDIMIIKRREEEILNRIFLDCVFITFCPYILTLKDDCIKEVEIKDIEMSKAWICHS